MRVFMLVGWVLPVLLVAVYAITRRYTNDELSQ